MPLFILTSLSGIALLVSVVRTLRRPDLGQRSAALWIGISLVVVPVMFVPALLDPVAGFLGASSGADLALASGLLLLLLLAVNAAHEQHGLRARSSLLALELSSLRAQLDLPATPVTDGPTSERAATPPVPRGGGEDRFADLLEDGSLR